METLAETLLKHSLNLYALMEFGSRMKLLGDDKRFKQSNLLALLNHRTTLVTPPPLPRPLGGGSACSVQQATRTPTAPPLFVHSCAEADVCLCVCVCVC